MDRPRPADADVLLAHADFLRALARGLLGRDSRVEDVVQETWLAALQRGPRHAGSFKGWLGTVARNVALTIRRRDASRDRREQAAPPPRRMPSAREIAEREENRRLVLAAVFKLEEPYRSAILCRYYEGIESAAYFSIRAGTVNLTGADQEIEVRLPGGVVSGRLQLVDSRSPASKGLKPALYLVLNPEEGEKKPPAGTAIPNRQGKYTFIGVPPGRHRLLVRLRGYVKLERVVELREREILEDVNFTLKSNPAGTVRTRVTDSVGKPAEGVTLSYRSSDGRWSTPYSPASTTPGLYTTNRLVPGLYTLRLSRSDLKPLEIEVEVKDGETTELNLVVTPK